MELYFFPMLCHNTERQVEELNRVAETIQPASSKRGVSALDDILLSGREVPGPCHAVNIE